MPEKIQHDKIFRFFAVLLNFRLLGLNISNTCPQHIPDKDTGLSLILSQQHWHAAIMKVRMLTGTYLLELHKKKFNIDGAVRGNMSIVSPEDEDIGHM